MVTINFGKIPKDSSGDKISVPDTVQEQLKGSQLDFMEINVLERTHRIQGFFKMAIRICS